MKALLLLLSLASQAGAVTWPLPAGSRVVFLGDSITEQGHYTTPLEAYLTLRYPDSDAVFFNAGWSGDSTTGAAYRLQRDVLSLKPTLVTICYGMNDAYYAAPDKGITELFIKNMAGLVAELRKAGVEVVLLTNGMTDERGADADYMAKVDYNKKGLRVLADAEIAWAAAEGLRITDLHKLMNEIHDAAVAEDPDFKMIPDGIHPDEAGGMVMLYAMLQSLEVADYSQIANVTVRGKPSKDGSLETSNLNLASLPLYAPPAARKVLKHLRFYERFNALEVKVTDLPKGLWCLEVGGASSAFADAGAWALGVQLEDLWGAPWYLQSAKVLDFTREKQKTYHMFWRHLALPFDYNVWSPYEEGPHLAGIRANEELQPLLRAKAKAPDLGWPAKMIPLGPETLKEGSWLRTPALSTAKDPDPLNPAQWTQRRISMEDPSSNLDFMSSGAGPVYAAWNLDSPAQQDAELLVGSDDGFTLWLDGKELYSADKSRKASERKVGMKLKKGSNLLMLRSGPGKGSLGLSVKLGKAKKPLKAMPLSPR